MQLLEFKLTVPGHALLDDNVREFLQSEEALAPLPHSLRGPVSEHGVPHGLFSVRVEQSRVFVSNDWVVSIHARKLIQCVSAMAILLSTIGRRSDGAVEVEVLTSQESKKETLERSLQMEKRKARFIGLCKWTGTILASVALGAFVQWLACGRPLP